MIGLNREKAVNRDATCNCWVGEAMRSAGIRTAWFTPLPKTVFLYLP
jgi:hypothetical protein